MGVDDGRILFGDGYINVGRIGVGVSATAMVVGISRWSSPACLRREPSSKSNLAGGGGRPVVDDEDVIMAASAFT